MRVAQELFKVLKDTCNCSASFILMCSSSPEFSRFSYTFHTGLSLIPFVPIKGILTNSPHCIRFAVRAPEDSHPPRIAFHDLGRHTEDTNAVCKTHKTRSRW